MVTSDTNQIKPMSNTQEPLPLATLFNSCNNHANFCVTHCDTREGLTSPGMAALAAEEDSTEQRRPEEPGERDRRDLREPLFCCELAHLTVASKRSTLSLKARIPGK